MGRPCSGERITSAVEKSRPQPSLKVQPSPLKWTTFSPPLTEISVDEHQQVEKMGEVAPTMYLGMDGTGVPMRAQEVADRAGKQADGSAKTREAKLVTIWTAE